jgi:hypothetical protein
LLLLLLQWFCSSFPHHHRHTNNHLLQHNENVTSFFPSESLSSEVNNRHGVLDGFLFPANAIE